MGSAAQETPKQARKGEDYSVSSGRGLNQNSRTPANQEVKIHDSYQSPPDSTVRSRKAHKSRIGEDLSPLRQPQAIVGEGIISNNADQQIGEGLAPADALSEGDDLARAEFTASGCVAQGNLSANSINEEESEADI